MANTAPESLALANRFAAPVDGWCHLASLGEHRHENGGTPVVQVVDAASIATLVANHIAAGRPPLPVDQDHESHQGGSSVASGWIEELQARADGLWGRVRWTDLGEQAVSNGRFRYFSPVWAVAPAGPGRVRPVRLTDAALTNQPNLRGLRPLSNRQQPPNTRMKTLLKKLGLAEDASEESAIAAVETLHNRAASADALKTERDALKSERDTLLSTQVDADLLKYAPVIKNREVIRAQLLANRTGTLALLESLQPAAAAPEGKKGHQTLTNRQPQQPAAKPDGSEDSKTLANRRDAAVRTYKNTHKCSFGDAWANVKAAQPELFVESE